MVGTDLTVKRSCPQGGFGGRFTAPQATFKAASVLDSLLDQVSAIPTGFPDDGQAMFSVSRPGFGSDQALSLSFGSMLTSMLGIAG